MAFFCRNINLKIHFGSCNPRKYITHIETAYAKSIFFKQMPRPVYEKRGNFFHAMHEKPLISLLETVFLRSLRELLCQTVSKQHEIR